MFSRLIFITLAAASAAFASAASLSLTADGQHAPIKVDPDRSSGLDALFVAFDGNGLTATYTASSPSAEVRWLRFSALGGAYAEPVDKEPTRNGATSTLAGLKPGLGYIVEEGNRRFCFWVADWSAAPFTVDALSAADADCSTVSLLPQGDAPRITYYSINGRSIEIPRQIPLSSYTLAFDEASHAYIQQPVDKMLDHISGMIHTDAPYCDTRFTLGPDRFMRAWGIGADVISPSVPAVAVTATDSAEQSVVEADNQVSSGASDGELGGSAPADITFTAAVTDAAIFTEWQMSSDPEFADISLRFQDTDFTFTFRESGTTYVRFVCANANGSCEYVGPTYTVSIGESMLKCPNAFSPGSSEGVNDEWKVSYKSLVEFECHIFDRYGNQLYHSTDPARGWDGKRRGKLVPAGVYYYVITATGSDGRRYKEAGDINIINYN